MDQLLGSRPAGRKLGDDDKYNAVATRVMRKHGVRINDLNSVTDAFPARLFTAPGNVHFTRPGSQKLGMVVANRISALLRR